MQLSTFATYRDCTLRLEYTLTNNGSKDALAFTHVYRSTPTGDIIVDPFLAYCDAVEEELLIERAVIAPVDVFVDSPEVPLAEMIRSGSTIAGTIHIQFPTRRFQPYHHDANLIAWDEIQRLVLRIGYIFVDAESSDYCRAASLPGLYAVDGGFAEFMQRHAVTTVSLSDIKI